MIDPRTGHLIDLALEEDAASRDLTSQAIFSPRHASVAVITVMEPLVLCGGDVAAAVFARLDPSVRVRVRARDGARLRRGAVVLEARGSTIALLGAERTALNFLQRLSGIATAAAAYVRAAAGTGVRVVDTRKTTPGWRALEKYAVRCGGAFNHRASLGEHVLIKDNHIAAAGSVRRAVALARAAAPHTARIEVEADTRAGVREALSAGADAILLDNMSPGDVKRMVSLVRGRALIEVSGGIRLDTIRDYALPGVDVISAGALTHSVRAVDLSMSVRAARRRRRVTAV
jgi:nicotinate-nucleotide pyrophosphorylase (carboxylating)